MIVAPYSSNACRAAFTRARPELIPLPPLQRQASSPSYNAIPTYQHASEDRRPDAISSLDFSFYFLLGPSPSGDGHSRNGLAVAVVFHIRRAVKVFNYTCQSARRDSHLSVKGILFPSERERERDVGRAEGKCLPLICRGWIGRITIPEEREGLGDGQA